MLELRRHSDARTFLARAEPWLMAREIEHGGVLQSARQALASDGQHARSMYWATFEEGGTIVGCAYRTPPHKVGVTLLPEAAIAPLIADLAATYSGPIGGFSGPDPTVTAAATAWVEQRGGSFRLNTQGRLLSLPPAVAASAPAAPFVLRLASANDTALAQSWGAAASMDSGIAALDGQVCVQLLRARQLYFWADDQPRCMIGLLRETRASAAIGIVYTPAAFRRKGHATAALNELNRLFDERGVRNRYVWIDPENEVAQAFTRRLGCTFVYDSLDYDCT